VYRPQDSIFFSAATVTTKKVLEPLTKVEEQTQKRFIQKTLNVETKKQKQKAPFVGTKIKERKQKKFLRWKKTIIESLKWFHLQHRFLIPINNILR
jgi:hypothetical protein